MHNRFCRAPYAPGTADGGRPDIYVTGPPCQPFSAQQPSFYSTGCLGHPDAYTIFGDAAPCQQPADDQENHGNVLDAVRAAKPVVLIYENVAQFARDDPVWKTIPLVEFVNQLKEIRDPNGDPVYTHFKMYTMSPHQFVSNLHRERIYLVASGLAFGRDKAVDEVDEVMEESQQTRTQQETVQARVQEGGYMIHKQKGCVCQENQDLHGDVHTANGRKADREAEFPAGGVCATTATNSALAGDFFVVAVCTWIVVRLK